jgi:hypothetical protein
MRVHRPSNRACCFRCRQSFNTIDLVMTERKTSFLEAVEYLKTFSSSWNQCPGFADPKGG